MTSLELKLHAMIPPLREKEIHTWRLSLSSLAPFEEQSSRILSEDEKLRAAKYRFAKDRSRFLLGRATLRILLGNYLRQPPAQIRFVVGRFGKLSLLVPREEFDLRFNVSHSGDVLLLAFALSAELGIDVEEIRLMSDRDAVAQRCLSPQQFQEFRQGDFGDKQLAFFRFWTRKEALIKALGTGLSQPLTEFDVTLDPTIPPALTRASVDFGSVNEWTLHELESPVGYQAALAIHDTAYSLNSLVFPPVQQR